MDLDADSWAITRVVLQRNAFHENLLEKISVCDLSRKKRLRFEVVYSRGVSATLVTWRRPFNVQPR